MFQLFLKKDFESKGRRKRKEKEKKRKNDGRVKKKREETEDMWIEEWQGRRERGGNKPIEINMNGRVKKCNVNDRNKKNVN